jgi:hypothetical protein
VGCAGPAEAPVGNVRHGPQLHAGAVELRHLTLVCLPIADRVCLRGAVSVADGDAPFVLGQFPGDDARLNDGSGHAGTRARDFASSATSARARGQQDGSVKTNEKLALVIGLRGTQSEKRPRSLRLYTAGLRLPAY